MSRPRHQIARVGRASDHASIFKTAPISSLAGVTKSTGTIGSPAATLRMRGSGGTAAEASETRRFHDDTALTHAW
jgi:hypothetical protein